MPAPTAANECRHREGYEPHLAETEPRPAITVEALEADAERAEAALQSRLSQDWRDISTAPKDTLVLLFCGGVILTGNEHLGIWWDHYSEYTCTPTHWMPLPPPPRAHD